MNSIKEKIFDYVKEVKGRVSFAELTERIDGFVGGDMVLGIKDMNLIMWAGLTPEANEAMLELQREEKIIFVATNWLVYGIDGQYLKLPLAKQRRAYKEPRWMPVVINLGPKAA